MVGENLQWKTFHTRIFCTIQLLYLEVCLSSNLKMGYNSKNVRAMVEMCQKSCESS